MILIEAGLIAIVTVLCLDASVSDLRNGKIRNRSILVAVGVGAPLAIAYYSLFATDCLFALIVNAVMGICIGLIFYSMGIWGAGDTKLLIAIILLFPARLYCKGNRSLASCFLLITIVFILSFVYVVGDTLYWGIKKKDLLKFEKRRVDILNGIRSFLFFYLLLSFIDGLILPRMPFVFQMDEILIAAGHFIVFIIGMRIEQKAGWIIISVMAVVWIAICLFGYADFRIPFANWKLLLVILAVLAIRRVAEKYNYKTIPIARLQPGMILSMASTMGFAGYPIAGLPTCSTEDLKSRISQEEIDSVAKWAQKEGQEELTIVRKIPFALFIGIGTLLFTIMEGLSK